MNAYEFVDNLINVELRDHISDIDIMTMKEGSIVVEILKTHYNAKHIGACGSSCGFWFFHNPNYIPKSDYELQWMFYKGETFEGIMVASNFEKLSEEIVRLDRDDSLYWNAQKTTIAKEVFITEVARITTIISEKPHFYFGENRIWRVVPHTSWVRP